MSTVKHPWIPLADAFTAAALGTQGWRPALAALAAATGSRASQLIALNANGDVALNLFTGLDPRIHEDYLARGRADPEINPRVRAAVSGALLHALSEQDFITPDERDRSAHYREFARAWDIPWSALAPVLRDNGSNVVLAVFRSARDGHIDPEQKALFQLLVPHVHGALKLERALQKQGAMLAAGMFESLAMAAFVCDAHGTVLGLTPAAEALVHRGDVLTLRGGLLQPRALGAMEHLRKAIAGAAEATDSLRPRAVMLPRRQGDPAALVVDVFSFPQRALGLPATPRVLVVARGTSRRRQESAALLRAAYGLSEAETEVAFMLVDGESIDAIAHARGVGVATVRSQVKGIFGKTGVHRRAELTAHLAALG